MWSELGDYYLALQYVWNIVDNDFTPEFNNRIGSEMLDALVSVKNRYAIQYETLCLKSIGFKSSQTVD